MAHVEPPSPTWESVLAPLHRRAGGHSTCLLTPKGKGVASFHLFRTSPGELLLIFSEPRRKEVETMLQRYAALEGIEVLGVDGARGILSVQGPRAPELLERPLIKKS